MNTGSFKTGTVALPYPARVSLRSLTVNGEAKRHGSGDDGSC